MFKAHCLQFNLFKYMFDSIMHENPYAKLYEECNFQKNCASGSKEEVENIIRHLGLMYNTFGQAIKDFVKIVSCKFQKAQSEPVNTQPKFLMKKKSKQQKNKNNSNSQLTQNIQKRDLHINQQNQKDKHDKKRENLLTIKEHPRTATNHDNFDEEFMNHDSISNKKQIKSSIQKSGTKNNLNFNNLARFHSQFGKIQVPQKTQSEHSNHSNHSLLNWSKKMKDQISPFVIIEEDRKIQNENPSDQAYVRNPYIGNKNDSNNNSFNSFDQMKDNSNIRIQGGRKKKDRQRLTGVSCLQCEKYYKVMQMKGENYCDCTSRHRTNIIPGKKVKKHFTQELDLD